MPTCSMKERPILFSAPMVRAILSGTKTQTRRVVKDNEGQNLSSEIQEHRELNGKPYCPYGDAGERLWVRENFAYWAPSVIHYAADRAFSDGVIRNDYTPSRFRPSIHMPRWASRITLAITGVRAERLQDISEADAIAEGIERDSDGWRDYQMPSTQSCGSARDSYRTLWESINGVGSWERNDWVWVIEFRRID